jgi:hypothetical protein
VLVGYLAQPADILGGDGFGDEPAPIPEETRGNLRTVDHPPAEAGQKAQRRVTIALLKRFHQSVSPVLRAGFVAVGDDIFEGLAVVGRRAAQELTDHAVEQAADVLFAHLVHFESAALRAGGRALRADRDHAAAHHHPAARRRVPSEPAAGIHHIC